MSCIEKALKRATQQTQAPSAAEPEGNDDHAAQASDEPVALSTRDDAFAAPWTLEPADAVRPRGNGHRGGSAVAAASGPGALFQGFAPAIREKLVVGRHKGNHAAMTVAIEQYRRLAATLHHSQIERDLKVVMITSAVAGEGKSLTATNLALTLSESYQRNVLVIDADLRRPALHRVFQVPGLSGLSDGLKDDVARKLSLLEITPHLTLLPAGPPDADPMSVLTSPRMQRIVEEASARFDWVILDAPPVGLLTDANLLGKIVDGVLIIVQAGKTDYPIVKRAVDAIGREKVLGVVLNRVDVPEGTYGYKYGKYYAAYYGTTRKP